VVRVLVDTDVVVTYTPPLGLGPPVTYTLLGSTDLTSWPEGSAVADVGLPDQFAGGAHGLLLSAFDARTEFDDTGVLLTNLFDGLVPLLPVPPPIPLSGAVLFVDIADLELSLLGPLQSSLLSIDDPSVYYWGGAAPLRIEGSLELLIAIPGQEPPIPIAPVPFSFDAPQGALAGTLEGGANLTRLVVGVNEELAPDTTGLVQPYVLDLAPLGAISVSVTRMRLAANASYRAVNRQYGLPSAPPAPVVGCGIGPELAALLPALAWLRGRRRRA
jgi:hypothetical protein